MCDCCSPDRCSIKQVGDVEQGNTLISRSNTNNRWKGMIFIHGGEFLMGSNVEEGSPSDGEGPVRKVNVKSFYINPFVVANGEFAKFVYETGYITEAERFGLPSCCTEF